MLYTCYYSIYLFFFFQLNKSLKQVQTYSFRTCVELDVACDIKLEDLVKESEQVASEPGSQPDAASKSEEVVKHDPNDHDVEEKIIDEIGGVLWRNLYLCREDVTEEHILEFAR